MRELNIDFQSAFDGLMLGDGSVTKSIANKNYKYAQTCKHKEWLDNISDFFRSHEFHSKVITNNHKAGGFSETDYTEYIIQTSLNRYFTEQHARWYMADYNVDEYSTKRWHLDKETGEWFAWKKTVPKDIKLTPECLLNWFLGDGTRLKTCGIYNVQLSTCGFTKSECEFLSCLINDCLDIESYIHNKYSDKYAIHITKKQYYVLFFDYLKSCKHMIPLCYSCKFPEVS